MNKDKLIPELRFPEFGNEGEWAKTTLGDIGEFIGGGTPDTGNSEYWNGDIQWYTPTEVKEGKIGKSIRTITEEGLRNSSAKLLPIGALLLTTRATIGDIAIANLECTTNQGFQSLIVKNSEDNTFWFYWIIQHKNELIRKASGSTFSEIGKNEIVKIKALKPQKNEQQKIASCLSSLDEVIAAHSQKLELLKDHKKGLLQNLFPQEGEKVPKYRFKEFENKGEWEEKILEDVTDSESSSLALNKIEQRENGFPVYGADSIVGYIDEFQQEAKYISIVKDGSGVGRLNLCEPKSSILGTLACIKSKDLNKYNLDWIYYQMNTIDFSSYKKGSGIPHIYFSDFKKEPIGLPTPQEQQKIGSCLSSLDALITAQAEKIEQLKLHKKGLMQGLFPKIES